MDVSRRRPQSSSRSFLADLAADADCAQLHDAFVGPFVIAFRGACIGVSPGTALAPDERVQVDLVLVDQALFAGSAWPVPGQPLIGLSTKYQSARSGLPLERVIAVVSIRLHPRADRVDDTVEGGLRRRDQLSISYSPSVHGALSCARRWRWSRGHGRCWEAPSRSSRRAADIETAISTISRRSLTTPPDSAGA